jgi:hypothetical protein
MVVVVYSGYEVMCMPTTNLYLSALEYAALANLALDSGRRVSELAREAVREYLKAKGVLK